VFDDGNYGFYHAKLTHYWCSYGEALLKLEQTGEAITALETAYHHAREFDIALEKLRREGEIGYTSVYMNTVRDLSDDVYAVPQVPELLNYTLLDEADIFWQKLHDHPRYTALIGQIRQELNA